MAETTSEILAKLRREIREVTPDELVESERAGALVLDVREPDEVAEGHIPGARTIPRGFLELKIEQEVPERSRPMIVV